MVRTLNPEAKAAEKTEVETKTWKIADRAKQAIKNVQEETEKRMKGLMARGETYGKESLHTIQEKIAPAVRLSENIFNRAKGNAEWLQERIEEGVTAALGKLHIPTTAEFAQLMDGVKELGTKVDALAKAAEEGVRSEVADLRKGIEKLGKSLTQVELRVRRMAQAKGVKPAVRKGTKPGHGSD